jgi:hypothetical protein
MLTLLVATALLSGEPPAEVARPPARELVTVVMPPEVAAEIRKARLKERYQAELKQTLKRRRASAARKSAAKEEERLAIRQRLFAVAAMEAAMAKLQQDRIESEARKESQRKCPNCEREKCRGTCEK